MSLGLSSFAMDCSLLVWYIPWSIVPWDPMGRLTSPSSGTGGTSHGIPGYHVTLGWDRQGQSIMYPRPLEWWDDPCDPEVPWNQRH